MNTLLAILFGWLAAKKGGLISTAHAATPAATPAPAAIVPSSPTAAAAAAQQAANAAAAHPTPQNLATAAQAAQHAAAVTTQAAQTAKKAAATPKPWPQAKPTGLPPFPSGWEVDVPPPPEVVTRAWQLLPVLWKRGKGATAVETTGGRWITYQAQDHGGGKKGVTAYRVKGTGKAVSTKASSKPKSSHGATANF